MPAVWLGYQPLKPAKPAGKGYVGYPVGPIMWLCARHECHLRCAEAYHGAAQLARFKAWQEVNK